MQSDKEICTSLPEPKRESVYEILQKNLKRADRRTFVHRSIVIGEHSFGMNWAWGVEEVFRALITDINENYTDENLTGVLICYSNYFVHLVEGSEDAQINYIATLFSKYDKQLGPLKFLAPFHHIYKRALDTWITVKGTPPRLIKKIDENCDINETSHHVLTCLKKLFKLCNFIKEYLKSDPSDDRSLSIGSSRSRSESQSTLGSISSSLPQASHTSVGTIGLTDGVGSVLETGRWKMLLPEYGTLAFLLQSPYLRNVRERVSVLNTVAHVDIPEDFTWPIPGETISQDTMFEPKIDPAIDLPISKK